MHALCIRQPFAEEILRGIPQGTADLMTRGTSMVRIARLDNRRLYSAGSHDQIERETYLCRFIACLTDDALHHDVRTDRLG